MATESTTGTTSTDETSGQEQQGQQQATGTETGQGEQQQTGTEQQSGEPVKLPDDHPLVKAYNTQKTTLANQKSEMAELRSKSAKVTQLEEELSKRPTTEALETIQTRYDRLEEFLQKAGGPLGRALDSRSFTRDLFETDKDIDSIVKDWRKANPTATSQALSSGGAQQSDDGKIDPNALLRAAAGK
jgi:hypothetical protein